MKKALSLIVRIGILVPGCAPPGQQRPSDRIRQCERGPHPAVRPGTLPRTPDRLASGSDGGRHAGHPGRGDRPRPTGHIGDGDGCRWRGMDGCGGDGRWRASGRAALTVRDRQHHQDRHRCRSDESQRGGSAPSERPGVRSSARRVRFRHQRGHHREPARHGERHSRSDDHAR